MGISLSLNAVVDALVSREAVKREEVGEYLEAVASDAQLLAELWEKVWYSLQEIEHKLDEEEQSTLRDELGKIFPQLSKKYRGFNSRIYGRLEKLYISLTPAIGGKVNPEFHNKFCFHLASLIQARDKSHDFINSSISNLGTPYFLTQKDCSNEIQNGKDLIELLYNEANELDSLSKLYKANGTGSK